MHGGRHPQQEVSQMNAATAAATSVRIAVLAAVLGAAAILGLAFGSALDGRTAEVGTVNGYPPGWQGVAPIPVAQHARFSLEALDAVRVARGDPAAPATEPVPATDDVSDIFLRHPEYRQDSGADQNADSATTEAAPKGIPPQVE
jgi:hypothetical protein